MSEIRSVYLTFPDVDTALTIARTLVDEHLVACVNLLPRATSVYRWEGRVETQEEVLAFAKTTAAKVDALSARVAALHPHEVPCVVALTVVGGDAAYLDWVANETTSE